MRNFQRKTRWKNILESWPVLILLAVLVLFFAWGVIGLLGKMRMTSENKRLAEDKVAELEKEKQKLSSDIEKLKTDEGKEESIREKFGLAKEGEGEIVIVEDKNLPVVPQTSSSGFFTFFKNLFK